MDNRKNGEVQKAEEKKSKKSQNAKTLFCILGVSAACLVGSALYTKKEIEKIEKNER